MVVAGVHVGDIRLHHVLYELLEGDLRNPAQLLLGLGAVTLKITKEATRKSSSTRRQEKKQEPVR